MYLQIRVQTHVTSVLYYQFMLLQSGKKEVKIKKLDIHKVNNSGFSVLCIQAHRYA